MRRYLLDRERLVAEVRWHPVWLIRPVLYVVGAAIVGTYLAVRVDRDSPLLDLAGFAFLATLGFLGWKLLEWHGERLVVTDRRLIMITGLFTRRVGVMPLRKVTDMTFEQPLFGRLLKDYGWGTFVLESAGQDQAMHRIPYLPEPELLYAQVSHEIFGESGPYSGGPGSVDPDDDLGAGPGGQPRSDPAPTRADRSQSEHEQKAHEQKGGEQKDRDQKDRDQRGWDQRSWEQPAGEQSAREQSAGSAPAARPPGSRRDDTREIPAVRDKPAGPAADQPDRPPTK